MPEALADPAGPSDRAWRDYAATLAPHERPVLPGSPATPDHPPRRRLAYAAVSVLVTLAGGLGAAIVTANQALLAGDLGVSVNDAAWLPVVFVMANACMNLLLVKFRQQYGLQVFTQVALALFVAVSLAHLLVDGLVSALVLRVVAGISAAGMSSLGILYMIQASPPPQRMRGLCLAIGLTSLNAPLARLVTYPLVERGGWRAVYAFEAGLAILALAAVLALRLPPSERLKAYEPLDFLTFGLFAPGAALLSVVLGMGRVAWWTEAPWIGACLAAGLILLGAALVIEHQRARPLLNLRWMARWDIVRLGLSILGLRVVLAEQTSGAVGFLQGVGLGPDQLYLLFFVVLAATLAGIATSALTLDVARLNLPIATALALVAIGALADGHATAATRPVDLYASQALIAFAAALFIGPAMLIGFGRVLADGPRNLVSFLVLFSLGQNVGGLAGSALVGTLQVIREKFHSSRLVEAATLADPGVVLRLQQLAAPYGRVLVDPAGRSQQAQVLLAQQFTQQANILAYDDVFLAIAAAAALGAAWIGLAHLCSRPPAAPQGPSKP